MKRNIVFIIYPGVTLLDVTGPAQVFSSVNNELSTKRHGYQVILASAVGGNVLTDTGIELITIPLDDLTNTVIDTLIVAGGNGVFTAANDLTLLEWLKCKAPKIRRLVSTCMGAFLLAETGLLKNKKITTHWRWSNELSIKYPELNVCEKPIFIKEGSFSSSAGVSAGIDLSLSLVSDDHNHSIALSVAKNLVLYLQRSGFQTQFSSILELQSSANSHKFDKLHSWINKNLDRALSVEILAEYMNMSSRNFSRMYTKNVGKTPAKAVEILRFEHAKSLLETTNLSINIVSKKCGFQSYERMRRTFIRQIGISPLEYKDKFGTNAN